MFEIYLFIFKQIDTFGVLKHMLNKILNISNIHENIYQIYFKYVIEARITLLYSQFYYYWIHTRTERIIIHYSFVLSV